MTDNIEKELLSLAKDVKEIKRLVRELHHQYLLDEKAINRIIKLREKKNNGN